jgi:pilus assembly protein CpaC
VITSRLLRPATLGALGLGLALSGSAVVRAQAVPPPPTPPAAAAQPQTPPARPGLPVERVPLTAGRSTVINTDFDIIRFSVTNPAVADATAVGSHEILIDGKAPGTVSLIVWSSTDRKQYDLVVEPAVTTLQQQLRLLFPGEDISVSATEEAIILSGSVSSNSVSLRSAEIAQASSSKMKVINMLQLPGGQESQQVMLQVRFAEVNRRAMTDLGVSLFTGPNGSKDWVGRSTTQQFAAPNFDTDSANGGLSNKLTFSDFLNLFLFNTKYNVGAVITALKSTGFFQSLAEPNLIAYNNEEASFLAGGEIPVPVVQGGGNSNAVTVTYKEFGIRLTFKPTIAGDVIRLMVKPEVSTLDFANGVTLEGFRIPALSTRRAETHVELRDGQSFAIAGLLDNLTQDNGAAIPVLSRLPIIGNLFKSKSEHAERTELMVLITPRLVRALDPDEVPPLPTLPKRFLGSPGSGGVGEQIEGGAGLVDAPPVKSKEKQKPSGQQH